MNKDKGSFVFILNYWLTTNELLYKLHEAFVIYNCTEGFKRPPPETMPYRTEHTVVVWERAHRHSHNPPAPCVRIPKQSPTETHLPIWDPICRQNCTQTFQSCPQGFRPHPNGSDPLPSQIHFHIHFCPAQRSPLNWLRLHPIENALSPDISLLITAAKSQITTC